MSFSSYHQCAACQDSLEFWRVGWVIPFPLSSSLFDDTMASSSTEILLRVEVLKILTTCCWYSVAVDANWIVLSPAVASRTPQTIIPHTYLPLANVYAWLAILRHLSKQPWHHPTRLFQVGTNKQNIFMDTHGHSETSCGKSCRTRFVPRHHSFVDECLADFGAPLHFRTLKTSVTAVRNPAPLTVCKV